MSPSIYWAGCNYWVNQGTTEHEPIGTAQSMHGCDFCKFDGCCPIQKETETWEYTPEHDELARMWAQKRRESVET